MMNRSMLFDHLGSSRSSPLRLALFSCGLGNIHRGFEISTGRFFRAINQDPDLDVRLFAGGEFADSEPVWNVGRNKWLSSGLRFTPGLDDVQRWKLAYVLEQISFSFGLLGGASNRWQPEVVWTKEVPLAHILYHFRQVTGLKYQIIFSNGGGFRPKTYAQFDFIHHLQADAYDESLQFGIPAEKMCIIPNLVPTRSTTRSRDELRKEYGLAQEDFVVVCVAAWNKHHKRIDYLIEELARFEDPRVKLVLCGQPEPEGESLRALADAKLPGRVKWLTLPEDKVVEVLKLSDVFVLASLFEGLGAVIIEAAMAELPIICHPHAGSKFILQDDFWLCDLSAEGSLHSRLQQWRSNMPSVAQTAALRDSVSARFSEHKIATDFKAMVAHVHRRATAKSTLRIQT